MSVESELYENAVRLVETRYPSGWGGAAAIRLATGDILTSVAPETDFDALSVCMELGSFLEAHKRNERVTHSLCIYRESEISDFKILSPCGICQERLRYWGSDVSVAVTTPTNELLFQPLSALQPFHWATAYS
ncbi:cytidine deaminase [Ruegeria halocynthiae]|uniref:cytidine deaminase n=1 Tax=Ruegeria halocynthiae TaxID=985054 RepID=UPI00055ABAC0|nr:cytidine deaminase [Ruegeria halocynthiae]